jgi:hypothetical protein
MGGVGGDGGGGVAVGEVGEGGVRAGDAEGRDEFVVEEGAVGGAAQAEGDVFRIRWGGRGIGEEEAVKVEKRGRRVWEQRAS